MLLQVTVVAQVVQVKNQATNSSYTLDDGGGRFEARHWTDASQSEEDNGIRYVHRAKLAAAFSSSRS